MVDTIFAISSGAPPAAIAIIRVSGPQAGPALTALAGSLPPPRHARYARLRDHDDDLLDQALVLWLPGPNTATGEDIAELHCHGGRAVCAVVERVLASLPGLRRAEPGEFTRRAFVNGRIDLAQAEGLADLLSAETELQRRGAMEMAGGAFSAIVAAWRNRILDLSAALEAVLDFGDEDDVGDVGAGLPGCFADDLRLFHVELATWLNRPRAEALREGFLVAIAGPPNAGKSTLFNALVESEAAITAPIAGTTRDVLMRPISIGGVPFQFLDTAGLRSEGADPMEAIGIARARDAMDRAALVLWLGPEGEGPNPDGRAQLWEIAAQVDRANSASKGNPRHRVSALTGAGVAALRDDLVETARRAMPAPGMAALNERQHQLVGKAAAALAEALAEGDPLLNAECLRLARLAFDALLGRTTTEDMLDALFGRFCIGK